MPCGKCYAERRCSLERDEPPFESATCWILRRRWLTADLERFIRSASSPRFSSGFARRHRAISRSAGGRVASFPSASSASIATAWRNPEPIVLPMLAVSKLRRRLTSPLTSRTTLTFSNSITARLAPIVDSNRPTQPDNLARYVVAQKREIRGAPPLVAQQASARAEVDAEQLAQLTAGPRR